MMCLLIFRLMWVYLFIKYVFSNSEYKFQPCDVSKEPFQVTYSQSCDRACFQKCNAEPDLSRFCVNLPQYCEGLSASCGQSGCECVPNKKLRGNLYSPESLLNDVVEKVLCENDYIHIQIDKCAVNKLGFTLSDFYINGLTNTSRIPSVDDVMLKRDVNNSCLGRVKISEMGLFYLFQIRENLSSCNGMMQVDDAGNKVTVYNAIKGSSRSNENLQVIYISFSCTYEHTEDGSLRPLFHDVDVYSGNFHEDFNLDLILWEDEWQGRKYITTDKMMSRDFMYVSVGIKSNATNHRRVQILQASVSPSSNADDVNSIPLITNRCVNADDPHNAGVMLRRNGEPLVAEFKFRLFSLLRSATNEDEKIYVHVVAHMCNEIFEGNCLVNCQNRERRVAELPKQHTKNVTSSPIILSKWRKTINETGRNITVLEALQYITESWEMTLAITCVLLLILTLMISMCILLMKIGNNSNSNDKEKK